MVVTGGSGGSGGGEESIQIHFIELIQTLLNNSQKP